MTKKPSYRFVGYTEPWEEKKLGEVSTHRSGTSIEKYFAGNGVYKVISIGSYGLDGEYIDQGIRAISNEVTDKKIVKENELTMVLNDKTSNGTIIGRTLLIKSSNEFVVNQRTEIISPKEILDSQYAYVVLNGNFREQVKKIVQGGTQIYVNYSSVEQLKLPLPSLPEQTAIGSFFQDIDQLISLQQRKLEVLKEQKKTYLKLLFPAKGQTKPALRFAGFEDEWEQQKASEIFYSVSDKNHVDLPVLSASQEYGMVKRDEIGIDIKYDKASVKTYKRVKPGQFVIHLRSFQGGFAHSDIEGITSPAYTVLDFSKSNKHFDLFWKEVFTSQNFIKRLETVTYGIRDGRSISFSDFSSLKLQFPSLPE
nr:restriction endonuclease subunit S [Streptococcus mitis]